MTDILIGLERIIGLVSFGSTLVALGYFTWFIWVSIGKKMLQNKTLTLREALAPIQGIVTLAVIMMIGLPLLSLSLRTAYNNSSPHLLGLGQDVIRDMQSLRDGGYRIETGNSSYQQEYNIPQQSQQTSYTEHTVMLNETVPMIASMYGVPSGQLMAYNNLTSSIVKQGTVIRIPVSYSRSMDLNNYNPESPPPTPSYGN